MKETVSLRPLSGHHLYRWIVRFPDGGKRKSKGFKLKKEAESFAVDKAKAIAAYGAKQKPITNEERRALDAFREYAADIPERMRPTLTTAIEFYIEHARLRDSSLTCQEIADKLILRICKEGKGKRHIDDVSSRLNRFTESYGDWLACDVSTEVIDEFLDDLDVAPQTKINYRSKINQLFRYAVKIGACEKNPVTNAIKPKVDGSDIGILTPKQSAAYLAAANETVLPGIAIGLFAGLRESEIQRLDWADIDLDEGHITVSAKKTKTAQRRIVAISDNLRAWLMPYAQTEGRVIGDTPYQWRAGKEAAREAAGITEWPPNAVRHSFASYHLAEHGDAGRTALELGHTNQRIIFQHYRQLVKPKAAKAYWDIYPDEAENITRIKAQ